MSTTELTGPGLLEELRRVDQQLHTAENDRDELVREARRQKVTWEQIGEALGTSKQAAWERFKSLEKKEEET